MTTDNLNNMIESQGEPYQEPIPLEDEILGSIANGFNSVNLCNELVAAGIKNENVRSTVTSNMQHAQWMLSKVWIVDNLTEQQRLDIDNCIASSQAFLKSF